MTGETSERAMEPKQLSMSVAGAGLLPDAPVPEGYALRRYRPGDEDGWQELLRAGGFSEDWSSRTVRGYMKDPVRRAGSWVAVLRESLVSATFSTPDARRAEIGFLDYVVTHPDHPGQGAGPRGMHRRHEVLPRPRLRAHPAADRRLEAACHQPIPVAGLRARDDEGRHARPVARGA